MIIHLLLVFLCFCLALPMPPKVIVKAFLALPPGTFRSAVAESQRVYPIISHLPIVRSPITNLPVVRPVRPSALMNFGETMPRWVTQHPAQLPSEIITPETLRAAFAKQALNLPKMPGSVPHQPQSLAPVAKTAPPPSTQSTALIPFKKAASPAVAVSTPKEVMVVPVAAKEQQIISSIQTGKPNAAHVNEPDQIESLVNKPIEISAPVAAVPGLVASSEILQHIDPILTGPPHVLVSEAKAAHVPVTQPETVPIKSTEIIPVAPIKAAAAVASVPEIVSHIEPLNDPSILPLSLAKTDGAPIHTPAHIESVVTNPATSNVIGEVSPIHRPTEIGPVVPIQAVDTALPHTPIFADPSPIAPIVAPIHAPVSAISSPIQASHVDLPVAVPLAIAADVPVSAISSHVQASHVDLPVSEHLAIPPVVPQNVAAPIQAPASGPVPQVDTGAPIQGSLPLDSHSTGAGVAPIASSGIVSSLGSGPHSGLGMGDSLPGGSIPEVGPIRKDLASETAGATTAPIVVPGGGDHGSSGVSHTIDGAIDGVPDRGGARSVAPKRNLVPSKVSSDIKPQVLGQTPPQSGRGLFAASGGGGFPGENGGHAFAGASLEPTQEVVMDAVGAKSGFSDLVGAAAGSAAGFIAGAQLMNQQGNK